MVSGWYSLSENQQKKIKKWVSEGNTLITIGGATNFVVDKEWVKEKLIEEKKDSTKPLNENPMLMHQKTLEKKK